VYAPDAGHIAGEGLDPAPLRIEVRHQRPHV
jgi:hypothetical protein